MATLNLGILAHVDAGKTTLTERLLHAAGVIDVVGRVDEGTTQTDSLALERQRGITIKSAVVSFVVDGVTINLLDTPGHPDFIAEVERVLGVLDGAVLVVSAVEGVQPQTVVLYRALQRLNVPIVLFVNKIDRVGADPDRVVESIHQRLAASSDLPIFFGAALRGVGVDELLHAIPKLLPSSDGDTDASASGTVFKIERGPNREKVAVVRMFGGRLRVRDRVRLRGAASESDTVTAIEVFERGSTTRRSEVRAGEIARLRGLASARIGDVFGATRDAVAAFAAPALETAVVPANGSSKRAVFDALTDLAEQDPLINLRQDDARQELFLSLYGEVQKEIVAQTLSADYGLDIEFRPTTPVCIERPNGAGAAIELIPRHRSPHHPLLATVGLSVEPLPTGSGVTFELDVDIKSIPIHVFGDVDTFRAVMQRAVHDTLRQGLYGWEVTDCRVVMTDSAYMAPPRKWPGTTLSDFRLLTPLVLMAALRQAGTTVLEPVLEFDLEFPSGDLGPIMSVLHELDAQPGGPVVGASTTTLSGVIRVTQLHHLQARLPDLTSGEGVLETAPGGHLAVQGPPPSRPRTDRNPLDRDDYLRHLR